MKLLKLDPKWPKRMAEIDSPVDSITLPTAESVSQDREWCEVVVDGKPRRVRFHDYHEVYKVPGLYEGIFYEQLKCSSPSQIVGMLHDVADDFDVDTEKLRVLDVGAGNGMVGDELARLDVEKIVGIDIIEEAKEAALRDRPEIYEEYHVADLTDLPEPVEERFRGHAFNCLTTVAALGFGDIPAQAFLKALDLIELPGWMAFNIKEDFLHTDDDSGFCSTIDRLSRQRVIQIQSLRRYSHRLSISGEPLYYVGIVAKKLKNLPDEFLSENLGS